VVVVVVVVVVVEWRMANGARAEDAVDDDIICTMTMILYMIT